MRAWISKSLASISASGSPFFTGKAEHADHLAGDFGAELGIQSLHGTGHVPDAVHPSGAASTSIGTMPPSFRAPPVLAIIALAPSPWMS